MKRDDADRNREKILDAVLEPEGYTQRLARLRGHAACYDSALVDGLLDRAHSVIRRDPAESARRCRLARHVARALGEHAGKVAVLRVRAQVRIQQGRFPSALRSLRAALTLTRPMQDERLVAELEMLCLLPLVHLERYDEAQETGERVLPVFERAGDRTGWIRVQMALADLAIRMDRPRAALRRYSLLERHVGEGANPRLRAVLAANRAIALEACNRFRAARRHFDLAGRLFEEQDCGHSVAQVEYNAAYAESLCGHHASALKRYAAAAEQFRRLEDERHLAHVDLDRAEIHLHLHLPDEALRLARRAEGRFLALGLLKECAEARLLAGRACDRLADGEGAIAALRLAEETFRDLGLRRRMVGCVLERARLTAREGLAEDAARLADEAGELLPENANPLDAAAVEILRAHLELAAGRPTDALHRIDRARERCRRVHAPWVHVEIHRIIGRAHVARDQLEEGVLAYKRAVDELERCRGEIPPDEFMSAFLAGHAELYAELVSLLVRTGHGEAAFEFAERAKSRALVDLLARRDGEPAPVAAAGFGARRVRYLRERLNAVYARLFHAQGHEDARSARAAVEARQQASDLEDEIAQLLRERRLAAPEAASLETPAGLVPAAVRGILDPDTVLVEYFTTPEQLFTFVVTPDSFHVVRQDVAVEDLRDLLERFRFHITRFERSGLPPERERLILDATRANLGKLTKVLLEPVREQLQGRRLVVVPHGPLHHVPFHALPWGEGWIADRFELTYSPSAAVYGFCRRRPRSRRRKVSILGLPDAAAPEIAGECLGIADLVRTDRVYLNGEATLARLRREANRARVLHLATHGMFRREQPMLSSIRLADTWLNLYDIYGLRTSAELVVLSCCESGTADVTDGDEILGLTRGFLYAGARALLTTQWRVHDGTTMELMESFYRHLEAGSDAAQALKLAMAEIRRRHPHPFFWAPFFLTGCPTHETNQKRGRGSAAHRMTSNIGEIER